jgi:hypothetical protein
MNHDKVEFFAVHMYNHVTEFFIFKTSQGWIEVKYEGQVRNATGSAGECTRESREAYFRPFRRTLGLKGAWHESSNEKVVV